MIQSWWDRMEDWMGRQKYTCVSPGLSRASHHLLGNRRAGEGNTFLPHSCSGHSYLAHLPSCATCYCSCRCLYAGLCLLLIPLSAKIMMLAEETQNIRLQPKQCLSPCFFFSSEWFLGKTLPTAGEGGRQDPSNNTNLLVTNNCSLSRGRQGPGYDTALKDTGLQQKGEDGTCTVLLRPGHAGSQQHWVGSFIQQAGNKSYSPLQCTAKATAKGADWWSDKELGSTSSIKAKVHLSRDRFWN